MGGALLPIGYLAVHQGKAFTPFSLETVSSMVHRTKECM